MNIEQKIVRRAGLDEQFLSVNIQQGERIDDAFAAIRRTLEKDGASVISQEVYGRDAHAAGLDAAKKTWGADFRWPIMWLEDDEALGTATIHTWAIAGTQVEPLEYRGEFVGTRFEDAHFKHWRFGNMLPENPDDSRTRQAENVFDRMERLLASVGLTFLETVRTWFYNREILAWYDDFNCVRTSFFHDRKVFDALVPASTGIGASNPSHTALVAALLAAVPKHDGAKISAVPSPLQCPALEYGSSFSRGVELDTPDYRRIMVSGTASIDPDGATAHLDDVVMQVDLTMRVIQAILENRGLSWADSLRAIAYFPAAKDFVVLRDYFAKNGIAPFPYALSNTVVCRGNLLFEAEWHALRVK